MFTLVSCTIGCAVDKLAAAGMACGYLKSNKNEANIIEREKTKIYISALAMQQSALTDETNVQGQVKRRRTLNIPLV